MNSAACRALWLGTLALLLAAGPLRAFDEWLDQLGEKLTIRAFDGRLRARLSGTLDLEGYAFHRPAPGLIDVAGATTFAPRLSLFVDGQVGTRWYFFAQLRVDRGFDPMNRGLQVRLDEYALRFTPWADGRFNFQLGKFATVVAAWQERHLSWENPFITAPLPYENLTAAWDIAAPVDLAEFLSWQDSAKALRNPIVWGPAYGAGAAISGKLGRFDYAFEVKNSALAARPATWDPFRVGFQHPTYSGRIGFRPNAAWKFGFSASTGAYQIPEAAPTLPPGTRLGDPRQIVFALDVSYAYRQLQLWAELFVCRFQVPRVGDADTLAYFVEGKYKLTPQLFVALRWNQQFYGTIPDGAGFRTPWGRDLRRLDAAVGYRFTAHTQAKVQYSVQHENGLARDTAHLVAGQFTLRF